MPEHTTHLRRAVLRGLVAAGATGVGLSTFGSAGAKIARKDIGRVWATGPLWKFQG